MLQQTHTSVRRLASSGSACGSRNLKGTALTLAASRRTIHALQELTASCGVAIANRMRTYSVGYAASEATRCSAGSSVISWPRH